MGYADCTVILYWFQDEDSDPQVITKEYFQMVEIFSINRFGTKGDAVICAERGLYWLEIVGGKLMLQGASFNGIRCLQISHTNDQKFVVRTSNKQVESIVLFDKKTKETT